VIVDKHQKQLDEFNKQWNVNHPRKKLRYDESDSDADDESDPSASDAESEASEDGPHPMDDL
jgi:hypothetical protein